MADVILAKPADGVAKQIPCEPDARFIIKFVTEESTVAVQGDDLVFTFDNQSELQLTGYVKAYTSETAPDLIVNDFGEINGSDFWNAIFMEDLEPGSNPLQTALQSSLPSVADAGIDPSAGMVQPDDPSVLSYMVTMQTTGV